MVSEILYKLNHLAMGFGPFIQIAVGLVLAVFGLCFWLGGTVFGRISTVLLGGLMGSFIAFTSTGHIGITTVFWSLVGCVALLVITEMLIKLLGQNSISWRFISSVFYSFIGTAIIFSGMIILLRHKGASPINNIMQKKEFYTIVFLAMFTFGTFEQLLLNRISKTDQTAETKAAENKQNVKDKKKQTGKVQSWRTA